MGIFTFGFKVNKIFKKENATAFFTPCEIVFSIVNLMDAQKCLSRDEYFFVSVVFETYRQIKRKLILSKNGFLGLTNDIIAHLDLIAPYCKFCGNPRMKILTLTESAKSKYRQRAKEILERKDIFKEDWMKLHQEFLEEFHASFEFMITATLHN